MKKHQRVRGFSIIEFLLVLTAFVIFLGAAFIGYRSLKANGDETQIANQFRLFATGLKNYSSGFYNSYPDITCSGAGWTASAPSNNVASCGALEQYIGSFVQVGPWAYTAYTGGNGNPPSGGTPASSSTGTATMTTGYYTFTTGPISNAYVQAILNQANAYNLNCTSTTDTQATGSSLISCTSAPVLVSGSNPAGYF